MYWRAVSDTIVGLEMPTHPATFLLPSLDTPPTPYCTHPQTPHRVTAASATRQEVWAAQAPLLSVDGLQAPGSNVPACPIDFLPKG